MIYDSIFRFSIYLLVYFHAVCGITEFNREFIIFQEPNVFPYFYLVYHFLVELACF